MQPAFAVWLTGLPASGKSSIARELQRQLRTRGAQAVVLESDALRAILTPQPKYDESERDLFYAALAHLGEFLVRHGVPVIFDATANRRAHRDAARAGIARFAEVFVDCPLSVCMARDPKGLYRGAREGRSTTLPGAQSGYEAPLRPEFTLAADRLAPPDAARALLEWLERSGWISRRSIDRNHAA